MWSMNLIILYFVLYRECAIKFNDYFEFPREFDMEPYTVQGMAKIEGRQLDLRGFYSIKDTNVYTVKLV